MNNFRELRDSMSEEAQARSNNKALLLNIKHKPIFNPKQACDIYSERDGVPITYVLTSTLPGKGEEMDIFYRERPHPSFGNRYFGLLQRGESVFITNADSIEGCRIAMVENDRGEMVYSSHRHDYKQFKNGNMIDGGRDYDRWAGKVVYYKVENGELKQENADE